MKKLTALTVTAALPLFIIGCSSTGNSNSTPTNSTVQSNNTEQITTTSIQNNTQQQVNNSQSAVTVDQINNKIANAVKVFKNTYPNYDIKSIDINSINPASIVAEVEGVNDMNEIKVFIDQTDQLRVVNEEPLDPEDRGGVERNREAINTMNLAPFAKIYDVAKQQLNLVNIHKVKIDRDNNRIEWDVELDSRDITIDNDTLRVIG